MSVVSKNPFDLLGDDGDESPAPKSAPKAPAATKKAEPTPAPKTVPGAGAARDGSGAGRRGRGDYPRRGGAPRPPRDSEPRNTGPTSAAGVTEGNETPGGFDGERVPAPKRHHHGPDAHTKGPRGNRPIRNPTSGGHSASTGNRSSNRPRVPQGGAERRQFERKSGTIPDSQKKVDHGWGAVEGTAELTDEVQGEKDAQVEENAPETPAAEGEDGGWGAAENAPAAEGDAAPAEDAEPEEVTKSYDQYLAERAAAAFEFGKKEARQVGEAALEGTAFVREAVDEFFSGKEKGSAKSKAPKKEKVFIEVDGQFATPPGGGGASRGRGGDRGRGGRGRGEGRGAFRGGDRGGRGRGAPRGARGGAAINAADTSAFPALGA